MRHAFPNDFRNRCEALCSWCSTYATEIVAGEFYVERTSSAERSPGLALLYSLCGGFILTYYSCKTYIFNNMFDLNI